MTKDNFEKLVGYLKAYNKLLIMYSNHTDDIVISPKEIDGMPFQNTNTNSDPTNAKAERLAETSIMIKNVTSEINQLLPEVDRNYVRQIMILRFAYDLKWQEIATFYNDTEDNIKKRYFNYKTKLSN